MRKCSIDTVDMSLMLPIISDTKIPFNVAQVYDAFTGGQIYRQSYEELLTLYPFHKGDIVTLYLGFTTLVLQKPVIFSNTYFFQRQVYQSPQEEGDYQIVLESNDSYILVKAPIDYEDLIQGLGYVNYWYLVDIIGGTPTEFNIDSPDNIVANVLEDDNKSWIHNLLFEKQLSDGAVSKLKLSFNGTRSFNYLEIKPVMQYAVDILGITYLDDAGNENELEIFVEKFDRTIRVSFEEISAMGIMIYFHIRNFELNAFYLNPRLNLDYVAKGQKTLQAQDLVSYSQNGLPYQENILGPLNTNLTLYTYYQYIIGIQYVVAGLRLFENSGYYLSSPIKADSIGSFSLWGSELGTPFNRTLSQAEGAVEYYVIKEDYSNNKLINTLTFPIYNQNNPKFYEQLNFISFSDPAINFTGSLLKTTFRAHGWSDSDICEIELYCNKIRLTRGDTVRNLAGTPHGDYFIINQTSSFNEYPFTLIGINKKVNGVWKAYKDIEKDPANVTPDIYEIYYKPYPMVADSNALSMADLYKMPVLLNKYFLYWNSDGSINTDWTYNGQSISSKVYLKIIMRNTSYDDTSGDLFNHSFSPKLKSFRLGMSQVKPETRFAGLDN